MGCCKCEEYGWANSHKVVYQSGGNSYCLLHAPGDQKWKEHGKVKHSPVEFQNLIFSLIESSKQGRCDLRGTIFPHEISFAKYGKPLPSVIFDHCQFIEDASFSGVTFEKDASFCSVKFHMKAHFLHAVFCNTTRFIETEFESYVNFSETTFVGRAVFTAAKFHLEAEYFGAIFRSSVDFSDAKFFDIAYFSKVQFFGYADFLNMSIAKECIFRETQFHKRAEFRLYSCRSKAVSVHNLSKTSMENIVFTQNEVGQLAFFHCDWPSKLGLELYYADKCTILEL